MAKFLVWDVEYPEDGSTMYEAETKQEAIDKHAEVTDDWANMEAGTYDASEATPEQVAIHEREDA